MRITCFLLAGLLVAAAAPRLEAQALDGQWFKIVTSANGVGVNPDTMQAEKGKTGKLVRYGQFSLSEGGSGYDVMTWAPTESGDWIPAFSGQLTMLDDDETFVVDAQIVVTTQPVPDDEGAPNILQLSFNGPVKIKIKNEELKSAKIKTLGATSVHTNDAFAFFGKGKMTLTRVPVEKLPFNPEIMIKAGKSVRTIPALTVEPAPTPSAH